MEVRECCCGSSARSIQSYARQGYIPEKLKGVDRPQNVGDWLRPNDWPYICLGCWWMTYKCSCAGALCHHTGIHDDRYDPTKVY